MADSTVFKSRMTSYLELNNDLRDWGSYLKVFYVNIDRVFSVDLEIFNFISALEDWLEMIIVLSVEEYGIFESQTFMFTSALFIFPHVREILHN